MLLNDSQAVRLMEYIERYAKDAIVEGQSASDVGDMTVRMLLNDVIGSLPSHLTVDLPRNVREITGD